MSLTSRKNISNKWIQNNPTKNDTSQQPSQMWTEIFPDKQGVENNGINLQALQQFQYQQVMQEIVTGPLNTTNANYYQQHPVYYVCKSGHSATEAQSPNKRTDLWIKDACSKKLFGCKLRFANEEWGGVNNNKNLPYGGFPGTENFSY